MSRLKLFIVLGFALMFLAGLEVGRAHTSLASLRSDARLLLAKLTGRPPSAPATQPAKTEPRPLFGEIPVTPGQDEQIRRIFRDAHARTDVMSRQFRDLDRQRDEAIIGMLDPVQKWEYEEIQRERDAKISELRGEIGNTMSKAGAEVRALLNPDQQKKFDELKKRFDEMRDRDHVHHGGPGGPSWRAGGAGRRPHADPTTLPAPSPDAPPVR